jgi:hypothetical protein
LLQLYIRVQLAGSTRACAHVSALEIFPVLESSLINVKLVTDILLPDDRSASPSQGFPRRQARQQPLVHNAKMPRLIHSYSTASSFCLGTVKIISELSVIGDCIAPPASARAC